VKKTASGLQENVAGLLCYALFWVSGLIFYLIETDNKFPQYCLHRFWLDALYWYGYEFDSWFAQLCSVGSPDGQGIPGNYV